MGAFIPAKARAAIDEGRYADAERLARSMTLSSAGSEGGYLTLAAIAEHQGQIREACLSIEEGLRGHPDSAPLRSKLGMLLAELGNSVRAEIELRYALELAPGAHDVAAALGSQLANQGRHEEAAELYGRALAEAGEEPQYLQMAARLSWVRGRLEEARALAREAAIQARARLSRGRSLERDGEIVALFQRATLDFADMSEGGHEFGEAIEFLVDGVARAGDAAFKLEIANRLCRWIPKVAGMKRLLCLALAETWGEPVALCQAASRWLMADPAFAEADISAAAVATTDLLNSEILRGPANDPLFLAILENGPVTCPQLERIATRLRRLLIEAAVSAEPTVRAIGETYETFLRALAVQCLCNEYAFEETAREKAFCDALAANAERAFRERPAKINTFDIALLASYRPLRDFSWAREATSWPASVRRLVNHHIKWPEDERALRNEIPRATPVRDRVSVAVRGQYEEHPYPRWINTYLPSYAFTLNDWLALHFPGLPRHPRDPGRPLDVLVAGCGTGRDAINAACRFANAKVLAIDLSLASLAYGERKRRALDLDMIRFAQADILELASLGQDFDVVDCAGVLHHLGDPIQGWRVLRNLTRPHGIMMLALYSEKGRTDLQPARAFIAEKGYGTSADELRRFRSDVCALSENHPVRQLVHNREEFYSLSMLRDLLFHVEEHLFTIPQIAEALAELRLEFCGFAADPATKTLFATRFGSAADLRSLELWSTLEKENPRLFSGMYHFVARNPGNT
jgi:SAM-dependent methyltransferase/tetratricopeptide (TPR) repeat protein